MSTGTGLVAGRGPGRRPPGAERRLSDCRPELAHGLVRVLVVDDERALTDTTVRILESQGYPVRGVYDGEAALAEARQWRPSIVIMDVSMPGMGGIEAAARLRRLLEGARILLISGQAEAVDLLEQARVRGQQFEIMAKPIAPLALLAKVASLADRRERAERSSTRRQED